MKKISTKMFFTVVWRGICQVLGWFFGLFGYKREGKFAKCVWGMFSISAAILMTILAGIAIYGCYEHFERKCRYANYVEEEGGTYVSSTLGYFPDYDGNKGYIFNKQTREKVLKGVDWIALPLGKDSLVCYSDGKLRGYFNANTGKVVIEPKYKHAWVFSDGLGAVEEDGNIKYIDSTGKVVIDNGIKYDPSTDDYVFHGGYLVVGDDEREKFGLMDKTGKMVLAKEYSCIDVANNMEYWRISKGDSCAVYDKNMNVILPFVEGYVYLAASQIDVTMSDHTMRKYDYTGNLINDFYISNVRHLQYDTDETYYEKSTYTDDEGDEQVCLEEKTKTAPARLRAYTAGGYEGLMTTDGHVVTMPLYEEIEAIGPDAYLCTVSDYDKVIINGKGQIVR